MVTARYSLTRPSPLCPPALLHGHDAHHAGRGLRACPPHGTAPPPPPRLAVPALPRPYLHGLAPHGPTHHHRCGRASLTASSLRRISLIESSLQEGQASILHLRTGQPCIAGHTTAYPSQTTYMSHGDRPGVWLPWPSMADRYTGGHVLCV